jgi:AP-1 complex subunit mu
VSDCTTLETIRYSTTVIPLVLALSRRNTNAAEIILFLHRLSQVLVEYFKELEEESIRDNFVIIYELLDEMMDFGYPQTTESKILQELVLPSIRQLRISNHMSGISPRSLTN